MAAQQSLGKDHLPAAQHAAPACVRGGARAPCSMDKKRRSDMPRSIRQCPWSPRPACPNHTYITNGPEKSMTLGNLESRSQVEAEGNGATCNRGNCQAWWCRYRNSITTWAQGHWLHHHPSQTGARVCDMEKGAKAADSPPTHPRETKEPDDGVSWFKIVSCSLHDELCDCWTIQHSSPGWSEAQYSSV